LHFERFVPTIVGPTIRKPLAVEAARQRLPQYFSILFSSWPCKISRSNGFGVNHLSLAWPSWCSPVLPLTSSLSKPQMRPWQSLKAKTKVVLSSYPVPAAATGAGIQLVVDWEAKASPATA